MTLLTRALTECETLQGRSAGEWLFREGEEPQGIYLLHSGEVDLLYSAAKGDAKPLRVAQAPQVLGVTELISAKRHNCSAITRTSCLLGFVDKDRVLAMIEDNSATWFGVLEALSEDVDSCYASMRSLSAAR
jgi:CRP-like cAMP-binding protein